MPRTLHTLLLKLLPACVLLLVAAGCHKLIGPTNVHVEDPVRHYLPILQGDELRMIWKVYNDGPNPLIISDIQPACSSIYLEDEVPSIVPVGDSLVMIYRFATDKNVNLTAHTIRLFGNVEPDGEIDLQFDVQVVRPSADRSDYEERYFEKMTEEDVARVRKRGNLYTTDRVTVDELIE